MKTKITTKATVADIAKLREVFYDRHLERLIMPDQITLPAESKSDVEAYAAYSVDLWHVYKYDGFDIADAEVSRLSITYDGMSHAGYACHFGDLHWLNANAREAFMALVEEFKASEQARFGYKGGLQ